MCIHSFVSGPSCITWGLQWRHVDVSVVVCRVSSCGLRHTCLEAHGVLVPQSGIEPVSPALQARFLTAGPPEKSSKMLHTLTLVSHYLEIKKIIQHNGKALRLKMYTTAVARVWEMVTSLKVQVQGHSYGKTAHSGGISALRVVNATTVRPMAVFLKIKGRENK